MTTTHMPYIMPDGSRLSRYLHADDDNDPSSASRRQRRQQRQSGTAASGRDALWQQLERQRQQQGLTQQHDPELAALERAGRARARRMLNDRILRDLADADQLTPDDMRALFSPAPFGGPVRPGPFAAVTGPSCRGGAWEAFRSIDSDRQERLLERWAAAAAVERREERALRRDERRRLRLQREEQQHLGGIDEAEGDAAEGAAAFAAATALEEAATRRREARAAAAASAALAAWARVPRGARCALRRANVHAVLDLEARMLAMLEEEDAVVAAAGGGATTPGNVVIADGESSFGRLLAHGLAAFHGLGSASCASVSPDAGAGSGRAVSVWRVVVSGDERGGVVAQGGEVMSGGAQPSSVPLAAAAAAAGDGGPLLVTCADLLMAMEEAVGGCLTTREVTRYARAHLILSGATTPAR
jgi:hypothetical protein